MSEELTKLIEILRGQMGLLQEILDAAKLQNVRLSRIEGDLEHHLKVLTAHGTGLLVIDKTTAELARMVREAGLEPKPTPRPRVN